MQAASRVSLDRLTGAQSEGGTAGGRWPPFEVGGRGQRSPPAHRVAFGQPAGGTDQLWPSNRLVTDPSLNTSLIARAISGAIESTVSLSNFFSSGTGSVLVMMTSLIRG